MARLKKFCIKKAPQSTLLHANLTAAPFCCRVSILCEIFNCGEVGYFIDEQGGMTEIPAVEFTRKRSIIVRAVVYWGGKYKDPLI
jgi:hypothetical protein